MNPTLSKSSKKPNALLDKQKLSMKKQVFNEFISPSLANINLSLCEIETILPKLENALQKLTRRNLQTFELLKQKNQENNIIVQNIKTCEQELLKLSIKIKDAFYEDQNLKQESAGLTKKLNDIELELKRVESPDAQRKLRRQRAKIGVQIDDQNESLAAVAKLTEQQKELQKIESQKLKQFKIEAKNLNDELSSFQNKLPKIDYYRAIPFLRMSHSYANFLTEFSQTHQPRYLKINFEEILQLLQMITQNIFPKSQYESILGGRDILSADLAYFISSINNQDALNYLNQLLYNENSPDGLVEIFEVYRAMILKALLEKNNKQLHKLILEGFDYGGHHDTFARIIEAKYTKPNFTKFRNNFFLFARQEHQKRKNLFKFQQIKVGSNAFIALEKFNPTLNFLLT